MKYYWIALTIEIKTAVLPWCGISIKISLLCNFADFKSFQAVLLILSHFIDHFYNSLGHQNPGPVNVDVVKKKTSYSTSFVVDRTDKICITRAWILMT